MQSDASTTKVGTVRLTLIFDSEADRARFYSLCPSMPGSEAWTRVGTEQADRKPVEAIMRGGWGYDEAAIERAIARVCKASERELRKGPDRISPDLIFCYRIAFKSRCRVAKEAFLAEITGAGATVSVASLSKSIEELAYNDPEGALARMDGQGCGRRAAADLVERARVQIELLPEIVPALQGIENEAVKSLSADAYDEAEQAQWRKGFFEGAEPIVLAFLQEVRDLAELATACRQIEDGIGQLKSVAQRLGLDAEPPVILPGLGGSASMPSPVLAGPDSIAAALGLSPAADAIDGAKQQGAKAGRILAESLIVRVRAEPNLRAAMIGAIASAVKEGGQAGQVAGLSPAAVLSWRRGFLEAADPIVTAFLREQAAETGETLPPRPAANANMDLRSRLQLPPTRVPHALAAVPPARPLRPGDFGALPASPRVPPLG